MVPSSYTRCIASLDGYADSLQVQQELDGSTFFCHCSDESAQVFEESCCLFHPELQESRQLWARNSDDFVLDAFSRLGVGCHNSRPRHGTIQMTLRQRVRACDVPHQNIDLVSMASTTSTFHLDAYHLIWRVMLARVLMVFQRLQAIS